MVASDAHVETLVLDDARRHIGQYALGVAFARLQVSHHAEYIAALAHIELEVVVAALVGDLGEAGALRREVLVEIEELEHGRVRLVEARRKDGRLERRQRRVELRTDERQRLVLDLELGEAVDHLGQVLHVDGEQVGVE